MENDKNTDTPSYPGSLPMVRIDGAKIRHLRESKKLTQLYLSTVVGVTTDTISRWENRHYQSIKLENAKKLAKALEVSFDEILKQKEQPELEPKAPEVHIPEAKHPPQQAARPRRTIILAVCLIAAITTGIVMYSLFLKQPPVTVTAIRILPPHVPQEKTFPVLIRVSSEEKTPVSLIIKELLPDGTLALQGFPPITSIDHKENSLKWIRRIDTDKSVYAYMCQAPAHIPNNKQLNFNGTVTLKHTVSNRQTIEGANSLLIAPYHWADSNRDYIIDDEEILAVYDTYSDIEELPFDRDLIDSMWAGSGYTWDPAQKQYRVID